ncbi:hypothetical protein MAPG_04215 [Magnaporthiopsis poae ATCC 64411]|uniref:Methyltransferase n=1 Tax=Magnaporthiopsis poae (strain ATCC 64411 / 73-15) TaxID=644358 RepID=A0A0C4DW43_MAGP6|nr:hypothetical protein MAPG_04215 [Magnaporthiopsis poae ATCC 64411]
MANEHPPETPAAEPEIEPDVQDRDSDDGDSALDVPLRESLASIRSSILAYQQENGRTYHAMSAGKYFLPNDDQEIERLDLQHSLMTLTIQGRLCLCPKNDGAHTVLDLGTGTGIWAMDYADTHPEAEVIGVDLSPVQPAFVPPNCSFEIDDIEKDWTWSKKFDFIFSRMMTGSFADYRSIVEKAFNQLEPGGYFEAQDMVLPLVCDDGTLSEDAPICRWQKVVMEGMNNMGRPLLMSADQTWKKHMEDVGFEDVSHNVFRWPMNHWPRDQHYKELGLWSLDNMHSALEGASLAPLTRGLGWTKEEVLVFVAQVRKDLRNTKIHAYWHINIVYGRKPLNPKAPSPAPGPTSAAPGPSTAAAP